jgi:hypothetical protein
MMSPIGAAPLLADAASVLWCGDANTQVLVLLHNAVVSATCCACRRLLKSAGTS